ncbi:MAG: purine-binding chemotaxis protein CheW [Waddliaceae bacterium]|jgi:purine-binding chemotaxis protein CheW|nr:purine-binding chemotaxis protein CheW [Waddliaceae bacterium]MBT3578920.1 purine-binding chemotaxis protein CheW [Waddliaceae bacterium]MBT4445521.1 purine-binding chemotaxis protein CheW [Waddliaceae bacterium]MBT6929012.1 purine-binding chemotaxis protein CheW [Waddliaceae bacterium]MBT7264010.1 purine-binding chemotaxis protein CheW [Waddliaceae bacterium]
MGEEDKIILEADNNDNAEDRNNIEMMSVLSFELEEGKYGVRIEDVKEVVKLPEITRVPNTPQFIVGVINLRGEIVTVIDMRYFFGVGDQEDKEKKEGKRVIVTDVNKDLVGILVDKVDDTIEINPEDIQQPIATLKGDAMAFTKGQVQVGEDIIALLDLGKVLHCREITSLEEGG